jgi:Tol biopolymer transport system component
MYFVWLSSKLLIFLFLLASCLPVSKENSSPKTLTSSAIPEITETELMSNIQAPSMTFTPEPVILNSSISGWVTYSSIVHREPLVSQIFVKNLDTGEVKQLTNSGNNSTPRWSPDGSQIMFLSWSKENSSDINLMDKDGGHQQLLINGPGSEKMADWSPDGSKIVFVSDEDGKPDIYMMDLNTKSIRKVTNASSFAILPTWSSDGKYIAFESSAGGVGRSQIFIMNADGTDIRQMTSYNIDNFDGAPVWCPDDPCIIFTRFINGVPKLMVLDLTSKEATPLLSGIFDANLQEARLARSPSRGHMTFSVGEMFYAMDMNSKEIYPLDVQALDLSLYP